MGQTRIEYFQKLNFGGPSNAKLPQGGGSTPYAQVLLDNDTRLQPLRMPKPAQPCSMIKKLHSANLDAQIVLQIFYNIEPLS